MALGEYDVFEEGGSLLVRWMEPSLPVEIKVMSVCLLAVLPFLYFFRGPIARFADRHLHIHWSPNVFGVLAPVLSLICGALLLFVKPPAGMIYWDLEPTGVFVKSPSGTAHLAWDDVDSAAFDDKSREKSTLVLKTKNGRELHLVLSWLGSVHREKAIDCINRYTHNRFNIPFKPTEPEEE